jgi:K+-transporting ATPase c subunit
MTLLTGVLYLLLVTDIAQLGFPKLANGSLLLGNNGKMQGAALIGQIIYPP